MRINANSKLTSDDVYLAVSHARYRHNQDIWLDDDRGITVGKRGAITFHCHSTWGKYSSGRHDNPNRYRAASWTAWGYVIAELFTRDPAAHIGTYKGAEDFMTQVGRMRETYYNRRCFGFKEREGEPGQNVGFLELLSWPDMTPID